MAGSSQSVSCPVAHDCWRGSQILGDAKGCDHDLVRRHFDGYRRRSRIRHRDLHSLRVQQRWSVTTTKPVRSARPGLAFITKQAAVQGMSVVAEAPMPSAPKTRWTPRPTRTWLAGLARMPRLNDALASPSERSLHEGLQLAGRSVNGCVARFGRHNSVMTARESMGTLCVDALATRSSFRTGFPSAPVQHGARGSRGGAGPIGSR